MEYNSQARMKDKKEYNSVDPLGYNDIRGRKMDNSQSSFHSSMSHRPTINK